MTDEIQVQKKSKAAQPPLTPREEWSEFAKTAVIAVVLALLVRTFLYEPFNIPSGSMKPTLEVGDYLFVYKPAYGYSRYSFPFGLAPIAEGRWLGKDLQRGDVVVFKLPTNTGIDYIKRVVGMPGDTVEVIEGRLYINHRLVHREPLGLKRVEENGMTTTMMEYLETLPGGVIHSIYEESDEGPLDNTPEFTVPDGHYFVMGDNRDNSQDSRVQNLVGFVPYENIVGRASFLFFSTNGYANLAEVWKWPWSIRYSRLFNSIEPVRPPAGDAEATGPAVP
ncbi:MAG: signal peptidase I [Micavibrio sp.]